MGDGPYPPCPHSSEHVGSGVPRSAHRAPNLAEESGLTDLHRSQGENGLTQDGLPCGSLRGISRRELGGHCSRGRLPGGWLGISMPGGRGA